MSLTLRNTKGSPLTHTELDANFSELADGSAITALDDAKVNVQLSGGVARTQHTVNAEMPVTPQAYGAVGDGVTDDYAALLLAYNATPTGGRMRFPAGTYYLPGATTSWVIDKSISVVFDAGAKLKFDHHTTTNHCVKVNGAMHVDLDRPYIEVDDSSRVVSSALFITGASRYVLVNRPIIDGSSGAGIFVNNALDVQIICPIVKDARADGIHITASQTADVTERITVTSPITINTGDEGVSVVSYSTATEMVKDVTVTGHIASGSDSSGFGCAGGRRIKYSGVHYNCGGNVGAKSFRVEQDTSYGTHNCHDIDAVVVIHDSQGVGATIGKLVFDSRFDITVDTSSGQGVLVGSASASNLAERVTVNAKVYSAGSGGIVVNGVEAFTGALSAESCATAGVTLTTNVTQSAISSILSKNNNTAVTAGVDSILFTAINDVSVGNIVSIDESTNIERTLEINSCNRVDIGAFMGRKNGVITNPVLTGTNSFITLPHNIVRAAKITDPDDFLGDTLDAKWGSAGGTDPQVVLPAALAGERKGIVRMTTGDDAAADMATNGVQLQKFLQWRADSFGLYCEFIVRMSAITNVAVFVGFTDQIAALEMPIESAASSDTITTNASNAVGVMFDTAMSTDNWWLVGVATDVDATAQNAGVAPAAATFETWRIELNNSGSASFFRNGAAIGTVMTGAVTASALLTPVIAAFSRGAASRNIDCDFFVVESMR